MDVFSYNLARWKGYAANLRFMIGICNRLQEIHRSAEKYQATVKIQNFDRRL